MERRLALTRGALTEADLDLLAAPPRMALALAQQRDMIGRERFPALVDLLVESLSARLTGSTRRAT